MRDAFKIVGKGWAEECQYLDKFIIREEDGIISLFSVAYVVSLVPPSDSDATVTESSFVPEFDAKVAACRLQFTRDTFKAEGEESIKASFSQVWEKVCHRSRRVLEESIDEAIMRVRLHFQESARPWYRICTVFGY